MKKTSQFFTILFTALFMAAFTSAISAQVSPASTTKTTSTSTTTANAAGDMKTTMDNFAAKWQSAYNLKDATAMGSLYDKSVVTVSPDGTTKTVTKEEVIRSLESAFAVPSQRIEIKVGSATPMPDGKVRITGTYEVSRMDANGQIIKESGIFDHQTANQGNEIVLVKTSAVPNKQ